MTLYNVVNGFKEIALTHPNIRTAKDGSIYNILNANPSIKYGAFVVTQGVHRQTEQFDYYHLILFYVDRLVDDMDSNRLQIQSIAKQTLGNIIYTFCDEYDIDNPTITYHPFTEKFADETSGMYAEFDLEIPLDIICAEEYE